MNLPQVHWFFGICTSCLLFGHSWLYLLGAVLVLLTGLATPRVGSLASAGGSKTIQTPVDLGWISINKEPPGESVLAKIYRAILNLFHPGTYLMLTTFFLSIIKLFIGMKGEKFNYWTIFKRITIFYLVIIPYPAAFLAPVGYKQAQPNLQLMIAGLVFIFANVIGDLISSRITVWNFSNVIERFSSVDQSLLENHFFEGVKFELAIYMTTLRDLAAATLCLIFVLAVSNVMFGIQVGMYSFSLDSFTINAMLDRAVHFYDLAYQLFWFRDSNGAPLPGKGVAGMFIYGITTFIPTIIMLLVALFWTLTLPLRIVLQLPGTKTFRIISAELSVFIICTIVSAIFDLRISRLYSFLMTI